MKTLSLDRAGHLLRTQRESLSGLFDFRRERLLSTFMSYQEAL